MVYIDITEIVGWQGKYTGVPRVINEISLRYMLEGNAEFIKWDSASKLFTTAEIPQQDNTPTENANELSRYMARYSKKSKIIRKLYLKYNSFIQKTDRSTPGLTKIIFKTSDVLLVLSDWHASDYSFVEEIVLLKKLGIKVVVISYDLLPIVTPQYSGHATGYFTNFVNEVYPICDLILSISENTKSDIINLLMKRNYRTPPIKVIRLGEDFKLSKLIKPLIISNKQKYLLCVGTIEARKNHALLYYVYKLASSKNIDLPKLIIVGRKGWLANDIIELIKSDPDTKDKIIIINDASDEELSWLYKNCMFSLYPSFYEGWGLPIAESVAYGKLCIASNTSSMPEIAGDLIKYFNPNSTEDCLNQIISSIKLDDLNNYTKRLKKYKRTSWDDTFKQVNDAVRSIYND